MSDVVKVSIFLSNMDDFKRMNEVYKTFFIENPPSRTTVEAKLPLAKMLIEVDVIAHRG
jgi:2-iminobutanoate/2-iminopropanoate deaminase